MSYNKKCRWFSMEYVGNPGAVPACNRDAVLEAFDCSTCKENQINANPTNADRIRAMTDEELSQFLCSWHNAEECHHCVAERFCEYGHTGMIDWLKRPYTEVGKDGYTQD